MGDRGVPLDPGSRRVVRRSRTVLAATVSARGRPFLTPLWFLWRGSDVVLTTGPGSWTGRNVTATGRATLVFGGEDGGDERVVVEGPAHCVHGRDAIARLLVRTAWRYYVAPGPLVDQVRHVRQAGLRQTYYAEAGGELGYVVVRAARAERQRAD